MAVTDQADQPAAPFSKGAQAPLTKASHLPGYLYSSPEIYAAEKEAIFMKDWLCVGRVEEVENPGDYMTLRITDEPIVVSRDEAGALHAFANVCAHRGVEVASGAGNTKEFSCPYHGWLYDLQGKLVGAPYMKEAAGFDPANCRLKPLGLGTWAGWIFVTFNPDPLPLEQHLEPFIRECSFFKMEDAYLVDKVVMDLECNWKFAVENSLDIYHVQAVHRATFGNFVDPEGFDFDLWERGASTVRFNLPRVSFSRNCGAWYVDAAVPAVPVPVPPLPPPVPATDDGAAAPPSSPVSPASARCSSSSRLPTVATTSSNSRRLFT